MITNLSHHVTRLRRAYDLPFYYPLVLTHPKRWERVQEPYLPLYSLTLFDSSLTPSDSSLLSHAIRPPLDSFLVQVLVVFGSNNSPLYCPLFVYKGRLSLQLGLKPDLVFLPIQVASKALSLSLAKSLQEDYLKLCKPFSTCKHHNHWPRAVVSWDLLPLMLPACCP